MQLNTIKPAEGSKTDKTRVGRGIGCGKGKTCGRGHKGQTSRSGGYHKTGFEGGQMPLQRRVPKFGFSSRKAKVTGEIRLHELGRLDAGIINMETLYAANLINGQIQRVKIIGASKPELAKLEKAYTIQGIKVTKGARVAIEAAGGKIED